MHRENNINCQNQGWFYWLSGNIRRKLTLFVVVILFMVVGLFWFFTTQLLQPMYERNIRSELTVALDTVAAILDETEAQGDSIVEFVELDGRKYIRVTDAVVTRLEEARTSGELNLSYRCLEISNVFLQNLWIADNIQPRCLLHPSHETALTRDGLQTEFDPNGEYIQAIRMQVFTYGEVDLAENGMFVMGRTAGEGQYSVVVSTTMERIPQAVSVLRQLMLPLSLLLALFSITMAFVFSRWFTKPLAKLSVAAKEMAKGNYDVRVDDCGDDEIGELGRDFNAMAEEVGKSAKLQRDLMANVSHDLRTPLTLIKGYAETVRDLTGDNPEKRTEQLNVIVDESDRLSALVGSVMELSRVSSGTDHPHPVRFDLADLCDEVGYRYEEICRQQGYSFFFSGEEGCYVFADPDLLERALHNLLGNAISHVGEDGYVGLRVKRTDHGTVRVEVSDHGVGIDEKDLPHIFDRYYRSRADAGKQGTGLGLSITKAIFDVHSMPYGVITEKGKGSTFWFEGVLDTW